APRLTHKRFVSPALTRWANKMPPLRGSVDIGSRSSPQEMEEVVETEIRVLEQLRQRRTFDWFVSRNGCFECSRGQRFFDANVTSLLSDDSPARAFERGDYLRIIDGGNLRQTTTSWISAPGTADT